MITKKYFVPAILMLLVALLLATSSSASPAQQTGGPVTTATNEETGTLSYLAADPSNPIILPGATDQGISAGDQAMAALNVYGPQFGIDNPNRELSTKAVSSPDKGRTVTRYQQVYNGVPVMGGELVVNMTKGGGLLSINGEISPDLDLSTSAQVGAGEAQANAIGTVAKAYGMSASDFTATTPELWIYDARLLTPSQRPAELVWRMEVVHNDAGIPINELVLVNAEFGGVSLHFNQIDNMLGEMYPYQQESEDPTPTPTPTSEETVESSEPTPTETEVVETPTATEVIEEPSTTPTPEVSPTSTLEATPTPTLEVTLTPTLEVTLTETLEASPTSVLGGPPEQDPQAGSNWYVATTGSGGSDSNTCDSTGAPCASINGVLVKAGFTAGDTILVEQGTYTGSGSEVVLVDQDAIILGGWNSSFSVQDGLTTIDGENARRGITVSHPMDVQINRFLITNCWDSHGGGIFSFGILELSDSIVTNNQAGDGAGIFTGNVLSLKNVIISTNSGTKGAGLLVDYDATSTTLNNVTISHNEASNKGGGIYSQSNATTTLQNVLVAQNRALNSNTVDCEGNFTSNGYNLIGNADGCTITSSTGDQLGTSTNEIDPRLSYLYDSGNGVLTQGIYADSPALDAGSIATPGTGGDACEAYDQIDTNRPIDGDSVGGARCDIGAFEYDPASPPPNRFTWYVSVSGLNTNDCKTPGTSCDSLDTVYVQSEFVPGDTVLFEADTYVGSGSEVLSIDKSVVLSGGWDSSFSTQTGYSVIDGQNTRRGIALPSRTTAEISYFIVQNGSAGGGAGISSGGNLTLLNSAVCDNYSGLAARGGGISHIDGILVITNSSICRNTAESDGGGLRISDASGIAISNTTISGNSSLGDGGGIYVDSDNVVLNNITVSGNHANYGGGLYIEQQDHNVAIQNSIVAGNTDNFGNGDCKSSMSSDLVSNGYNLIGQVTVSTTDQCDFSIATGDLINTDPKLGVLTGAPAYVPLSFDSPAIDAGNPATPGTGGVACEAADQRGISRPIDGDSAGASVCDMGAYEFAPATTPDSIAVIGGSPQNVAPGFAFEELLAAIVLDPVGAPVPGITVTFTAPGSGASGTFSDSGNNVTAAITNGYGVATAATFTANSIAGSYVVSASTAGVGTTADFQLRNIAWYVATVANGGSDLNDCETSLTACESINGVLGKPGFSSGDDIFVEQGTYTGSGTEVVYIDDSVDIFGGWDSSFATQSGYSIIDGETARQGMVLAGTSGAAITVNIDRFIIENGNGSGLAGSGIRMAYTNLTMSNSEIRNGTNGAGLSTAASSGNLTLDNVTIKNTTSGSGIEIESITTAVINNSTIVDNTSASHGGGIETAGVSVTLNNVTISGNSAATGGGIYSTADSLIIQNSTITNNSTGGGLDQVSGQVYIFNSILAENTTDDCDGNINTVSYSLIGNNGCTITTSSNNLIGTSGSPIDPHLDSLQDNGGQTETHRLLSGSPAIDAGNPASPGSGGDACESTDQRGVTRPQEGNATAGAVCDMGAYELDSGVLISSGSPQSKNILDSFDNPLAALVVDGSGQPIQGETVTFTAPGSGASGTFADSGNNVTTAVSNASGIATAATFTANGTQGAYTVVATGATVSGQAEFSLTNTYVLDADLSTHNSDNTSNLPGDFLCDETAPDCTSGTVPDADKAHDYANDTYLFYLNRFGRDSIDGAGMQIVSSVLFDNDTGDGSPFVNAFWSGSLQQMVYGNGGNLAQADDVVGHELTHGVTDFEFNLFYYYQSGAINEALSDIFGEFVDLTNGKGDDSAGVRWLLGEDGTAPVLRDMQNPPAYLDPDKVSSPHYYDLDADSGFFGDNGGVHTNSGVVNKAAYLLTDGDTFNSYTVTALGLDKVAAIFYEVQINLLTTASDFYDLYYLLPQACTNLIGGSEGITAGDCTEVQDAVDAVELNLQPEPNYNPHAEICPQGEAVNELFFDDFESGLGNWTASWLGGTPLPGAVAADYWSTQTVFAVDGTASLWGNDFTFYDGDPIDDDADDYVLAMDSDISLPALHTAYLHFEHAFGFENDDFDGGWVEYTTNGGSNWIDVGSMFSDGRDYTGTINNTLDNRKPNHPAYVGDSHGYVSTRFSLDALQDEDVRIRFRISKDSTYYDLGWFIDNLRIYTCGDPPTPPEPQTPTGTIAIPDPVFTWTEGELGATWFIVNIQDDQGTELYDVWHENIGGLCTAGTCSVDPGLTLQNGDHKWRVRPWTSTFPNLPYSDFMNFTVDAPLPLLLSPVASGNPYGTTPAFEWEAIAGETWYQLYVWDSGASPVINGSWHDASVVCSAGTCTVDTGVTFAEDSYTWDVEPFTAIQGYASESFIVSLGPPEMAVEYLSTEIIDGDNTPDLADGTEFGSLDTVSGMVTRSFDIVNSGTGILSLTGTPIVALSGCGDFMVTTQPTSNTVAGLGSVAFELSYDPSSTGLCSAEVSIANNDADENPYNFSVQGTGTVAPEMAVKYDANDTEIADGDTTPDTADGSDFGGVDIDSGAATHLFDIVNDGGAVLNLTGTPDVTVTGCSEITVSSQPSSSTVAAGGGSVQFELSFDPSVTGLCSADISIANDDSDENPYNFSVQGTGIELPKLLSPVAAGNPHGTTPTFSWAELPGETWYQLFVWDSGAGPIINGTWHAANAVCTAGTCTFDPGLTFAEDDYTWDVVTFAITYDYVSAAFTVSLGPPEMAVEYNSTEIADGDSTPSVGDGTEFGNVDTSSGLVTRSFDIVNSATGSLNLTGTPDVDISGCADFTVSTQPASSTVVGGGSVSFELTYDPSTTGLCSAEVSIDNDDADENPYNFTVQGTGTVAPEMAVEYLSTEIVDGDSTPDLADGTDLGGVDINSGAATRVFTIMNYGGAVLNLTGTPDVTVTGCADMSISSQPSSSTVAAGGGSVTFELSFDPGVTGLCSAEVSIANDDSDENPYNFSVQGTGTDVPALLAPANGSTLVITNPTYQWVETPGATWYLMNVSKPGGTVLNKWYEVGVDVSCAASTCSVTPNKVLLNDDYTWTVSPYDGVTGPAYAPFTFTVAVPLPNLLAPADGSTSTTDNTPTYQWEEAIGASWYHFIVDGTSGPVLNKWYEVGGDVTCAAGTCSVTPSKALLNDTYTWYVVPWNGSDGPAYSPFSFTINLPLPALLAPADGSTNTTDSTPEYQWEETGGASWYLLNVDGTGGTALNKWYEVGADVSCVAGTCSVTPSTALPNDTYTWTVYPYDGVNGPAYAPFTFTLNVPPPPLPDLLLPADASTIVTPTPTYEWEEATGATWYLMTIDDTSGPVLNKWFEVGGDVTCVAGTCSVTPNKVLLNDDYTWTVQPWNAVDGYGPLYLPFTFTLNAPLPVLLAPADGSTSTTDNTPEYQWEETIGASWYLLKVDGTSSTPINQWYAVGSGVNCVAGTCSVTPSKELPNDTYSWSVQPYTAAGNGLWYPSFGFTINLPLPVLLSPTGTISTVVPTFSWEETSGETWYQLFVYRSSDDSIVPGMNGLWFDASVVCAGGTCTASPNVIVPNLADFYWEILTFDKGTTYASLNFSTDAVDGFNSQFNGDATGWSILAGTWTFDSGQYYTAPGITDDYAGIYYDLSTYANFDFEARLMRAGCVPCEYGLFVRDTNWSEYGYAFNISNDGDYIIWRFDGASGATLLQPWTLTPYVNIGTWNDLRVVANGSALSFYINGNLVWTGADAYYTVGYVGLDFYADGTAGDQLWVDWATLNDLNVSPATVSSVNTDRISPEQQALNEAAPSGDRKSPSRESEEPDPEPVELPEEGE